MSLKKLGGTTRYSMHIADVLIRCHGIGSDDDKECYNV